MTKIARKDMEAAQGRVGVGNPVREAEWALGFIEESLEGRSLGILYELEAELWAWFTFNTILGVSYTCDSINDITDGVPAKRLERWGRLPGEMYAVVPQDVSLAQAQSVIAGAFRNVVAGEPPDATLTALRDRLHDVDTTDQLRYAVMRLISRLPHGLSIQACEAPKMRAEEPCARLFLTPRHAQRYCSMACQQRAAGRRKRRQQCPAHAK